jgi:hypothetical protein
MWSWKVIVLEKFGAGMSLSYCATERKKEKNNNNTCNNNNNPVIPTSNQDGRQAKNRKRGDEILIVHCCFSSNFNCCYMERSSFT